jgi:hypothetical protein
LRIFQTKLLGRIFGSLRGEVKKRLEKMQGRMLTFIFLLTEYYWNDHIKEDKVGRIQARMEAKRNA